MMYSKMGFIADRDVLALKLICMLPVIKIYLAASDNVVRFPLSEIRFVRF